MKCIECDEECNGNCKVFTIKLYDDTVHKFAVHNKCLLKTIKNNLYKITDINDVK